jgi:dihydroorotate dehydrogenase (NAD+) catalytic subunit
MGGITSGSDAIEFMLAGARAIAIGTYNFVDPLAPVRIIKEIEAYMDRKNITDVNALVGLAHK